ncbi:MAG: hypothetical protein ACOC1D_03765 [Prolixibacteraceae bacterium]
MVQTVLFLFSVIVVLSFQDEKKDITRFNQSKLFSQTAEIVPHIVDFQDTIPNDTLFEYRDKNHLPLMYSRKILTGVCIDGKCRLVRTNLFWHVTGRYLGFELPGGEFFSKTEHHPFKPSEYDRLHVLLADPQSALSQYTLDELVPNKDTTKEVDAVSTATIADVLDYIVEGAVFTTYTLWHIAHGTTRREIELITTKKLTPELILRLLSSETIHDQVWALNQITDEIEINDSLQNKIFRFIGGNDVYLVERALSALPSHILSEPETQFRLAEIFKTTGFLKKRLILQRMHEAHSLNIGALAEFTSELNTLSGTLVKSMIELLIHFDIQNKNIIAEVQPLLKNENRYIANQALKYLESLDNPDRKTARTIEKFKRKNRF